MPKRRAPSANALLCRGANALLCRGANALLCRSANALLWCCVLGLAGCSTPQQHADSEYQPNVKAPSYAAASGPLVLFDVGHNNFHTIDGRYAPFARLLEADGYQVEAREGFLTSGSIGTADVFVISNALHERNIEDWTLPTPSAFTDSEIDTVVDYVERGGSLLLIADHMPFPGAIEKLAGRFGIEYKNGFTVEQREDHKFAVRPMIFDRQRGLLGTHVILEGRQPTERIQQVATFTGTAFRCPKGDPLLLFADNVVLFEPKKAWHFQKDTPQTNVAGWMQGAALRFGQGRVAVFGEAAMFTSQRSARGGTFGMSAPMAQDNEQFLLNTMHWLTGLLDQG